VDLVRNYGPHFTRWWSACLHVHFTNGPAFTHNGYVYTLVSAVMHTIIHLVPSFARLVRIIHVTVQSCYIFMFLFGVGSDEGNKDKKSGPRDFRYFGLASETVGIFLIGWKMAEEIDFENRHFWNFKSHMTLTLTSDDLKSYRRECLINLNKFHYLVCGCIVFDCGRTYGQTDVRTDGRTFLPSLLGHLRRWPKNGNAK